MDILEMKNIHKSFVGVPVLKGVSLTIREGEVPGIHAIRYDSEADSITITHDAKNRRGFALGAVLAAEYTANHEGFLGMNDLFQF